LLNAFFEPVVWLGDKPDPILFQLLPGLGFDQEVANGFS
jgi:hypothetical protein